MVPKEIIEKKFTVKVISDEQFDDMYVYFPYTKDEKLIIPIPASEKHARYFRYRHFD